MSVQVCGSTGLALTPATGQLAWRVAREEYTRSGGILAVRENRHVGALPKDVEDRRGRYDTLGRTVYFADAPETAFAEVLQDFRKKRIALESDAAAAGLPADQYMAEVIDEARGNGISTPWAIDVDWQMKRCIHEVKMPTEGWWVLIDHSTTLNRLSLDLAPHLEMLGLKMLTLGSTAGEDRAVTTLLAQHIRSLNLFDGSRALGIEFRSKTGYGTCWAWWDRRADDGMTPGANDPKTTEDFNVDIPALRKIATDWDLPILSGDR